MSIIRIFLFGIGSYILILVGYSFTQIGSLTLPSFLFLIAGLTLWLVSFFGGESRDHQIQIARLISGKRCQVLEASYQEWPGILPGDPLDLGIRVSNGEDYWDLRFSGRHPDFKKLKEILNWPERQGGWISFKFIESRPLTKNPAASRHELTDHLLVDYIENPICRSLSRN